MKTITLEIHEGIAENGISSPEKAAAHLTHLIKKQQEEFWVILLDGSGSVIKKKMITRGLVNSSPTHPREVFRYAIKMNAASIILAHNHPSGNYKPSPDDEKVQTRLTEAGVLIDIPVLDHIIMSKGGCYSFSTREKFL